MPSVKVIISKKECEAALKLAQEGVPGGGVHIYRDQRQIGLSLRVQGKTTAWVVKWRDYSKTIGYLSEGRGYRITAPMTAREIAADAIAILKSDPAKFDSYIRQRQTGVDHSEALTESKPKLETWTLRRCFEKFIEARTHENAEKPLSLKTVQDIKLTYTRPQFNDVIDQPAALVQRGQIETIRDKVQKAKGTSSANKVVAYTRSVLEYCYRKHVGQSGLADSDRWWTALSTEYAVKARTRKPSIRDLVATMIIAEQYLDRPLPGRDIAYAGVSPRTLAGLWWLVLTCQRATAGLSLKEYDVVVDPERTGWRLATWDEGIMKGGKSHILPVPDRAWLKIEELLKRKDDVANPERWAFPSSKRPEVHLTQSGAYRVLYRLAARDPVGKNAKKSIDLLAEAGINWWTPHDVRRSLGEVMDEAGIPGGQSSILAHEIKDTGQTRVAEDLLQQLDFEAQRQAKITRMAYGAAQNLRLKSIAMQRWTDAVLDEYERQTAAISIPR